MHRRTSHYPISIFLSSFFDRKNVRASQFVNLIGYRNVTGGISAFDRWLREGEGDALFLDRLLSRFPQLRDGVEKALTETKAVLREEGRAPQVEEARQAEKNFKPFIFLETKETRPSSITMFAITGGKWKFISLPDSFSSLSEKSQRELAKELIRKHQAEQGGYCLFFGPVTAYRLVSSYHRSLLFDASGGILEEHAGPFKVPFSTSFRVKGREFHVS